MIPIWCDKLLMAMSTKAQIDGLWVGASGDDEPDLLRKTCDALELIKAHDPVRYKRILLDVRRVWTGLLPGAWGRYQSRTGTCQIDSRFAAKAHPTFIASIIVHEACHARMRRFGYAEPIRYRLERACRRQQYKFAERHPGGDVVITWLDLYPPLRPEDYTDQASLAANRQGLVNAARDLGVPALLLRVLLPVRDFWDRRAEKRRLKLLRQQRS